MIPSDCRRGQYDLNKIKRIYVNADGGTWIKGGCKRLQDVTFVLDEFHLSKYVMKMIGHMKDSIEDAKKELFNCIRYGKKSDFEAIAERLKNCTESEQIQNRIDEATAYIASNWKAAKIRLNKKEGVKPCSAEGHVYHVLSSKMSTQTMGWSKLGAGKMARLREYYYNGGNMLELAKYQKEELPMVAGAEEVILSASNILISEHTNRSKPLLEFGKYHDRMKAKISVDISKQLMFYLNSKL